MTKRLCRLCGSPNDRPGYCSRCVVRHDNERRAAIYAVSKAVRAGLLKPAAGQDCVDCGSPACDLDHRDYLKPLDVVPVCRSCNLLRGAAFDSVYRPACEVTAHPPSLAASIPSRLIQEAGVPLS